MSTNRSVTILMAEDDDDDFMMAEKALREARLSNPLKRVCDGEELLCYLQNENPFQDTKENPVPILILLDLNMPRKDGREALREIKRHERFKRIPVVVMTTSEADEDVIKTYNLGVNSFIRKPVSFKQLVEVMRSLRHYWFDIVTLPADKEG